MKLLLLVCIIALAAARPAINVDIINEVNNANDVTWKAGINKHWIGWTLEQAAALCGSLNGGIELTDKAPEYTPEQLAAVPEEYDARSLKETCPSTDEVRDQSNCGSCWAFGAVEAMTDRVCIASQGAQKPHLSAADMLCCCGFTCGMGCNGGYPSGAWSYWKSSGLVTGGNYGKGLCFPYPLKECDHHVNGTHGPCPATVPTPACANKCEDGSDWKKDKHFGASSYSVYGEEQIKAEIFNHGPVEAAFSVYEDFLSYKKGVYVHKTGSMLGGHAIKMLGWGIDNGVKYWIIANSWNNDWGNNGYFNIKRGTNECGIEGQI